MDDDLEDLKDTLTIGCGLTVTILLLLLAVSYVTKNNILRG